MLESVSDGLAQARVGLGLFTVPLFLEPPLEPCHHGLAVSLVMQEPLLRAHPELLGLGVHAIDFPQGLEDVPALVGKALRHAHEFTSPVTQAMSQEVGSEGALALGIDLGGRGTARAPQIQDPHGGVIVVDQGRLGGLTDQLLEEGLGLLAQRLRSITGRIHS